ncbi:MAG TPA: polysaccharide deacetylase family protein, partial [Chthoniobacterales bacterium]
LAVAAEQQPLVVSIHDVAPSTRQIADEMLADLAAHGVRACSLLVVPNYHQRGAAIADRSFMQWLRDREASGDEIVIHGYFHQRRRRETDNLRARLVTRSYTKDEGEFYDLDYDEAFRRITQARDEFKAGGLTPRGFIAPAWLLSAEAERAAADAEMEYTTRLTSVRDLRAGETYRARSLVYSTRSSWRRVTSLAWNGALCRLMCDAPLLRIGLHPPDYQHDDVWQQVLRLLDQMSDARTPTTYRDWIAERRIAAAR